MNRLTLPVECYYFPNPIQRECLDVFKRRLGSLYPATQAQSYFNSNLFYDENANFSTQCNSSVYTNLTTASSSNPGSSYAGMSTTASSSSAGLGSIASSSNAGLGGTASSSNAGLGSTVSSSNAGLGSIASSSNAGLGGTASSSNAGLNSASNDLSWPTDFTFPSEELSASTLTIIKQHIQLRHNEVNEIIHKLFLKMRLITKQ